MPRSDYYERQEARRERYEECAAKARQEAHARFNSHAINAVRDMQGEPIKVGHHSERRHRKLHEKADNDMRRGVEALKKADQYRGKAAGVGHGGISSDAPDAVDLLREKLAGEVASRDAMKAANKAYRDAAKRGLAGQPATDELVEELAQKHGLTDDLTLVRKAVEWTPDYSFQKAPFEGYSFSNLGANIRRIQKRIVELEAVADDETAEEQVGDVQILDNVEANRVQLFFPGKPSDEVRTFLKSRGFRWARSEGAWQRHRSTGALMLAREAAELAAKGDS